MIFIICIIIIQYLTYYKIKNNLNWAVVQDVAYILILLIM